MPVSSTAQARTPGSQLLDELRLQSHRPDAIDLAVDVVVAVRQAMFLTWVPTLTTRDKPLILRSLLTVIFM